MQTIYLGLKEIQTKLETLIMERKDTFQSRPKEWKKSFSGQEFEMETMFLQGVLKNTKNSLYLLS